MSTEQSTNGHDPSNNFKCPYCNTSLPSHAIFCGCCGKQVNVRKYGKGEKRTAKGNHSEKEQNDDTVRLASDSQKHLKRHKSSLLPENKDKNIIPRQLHTNSMLYRTIDIDFPLPLEPYSLGTEMPQSELEDTQPRLAVIPQSAPLPSMPTTPVPSILETWQQAPDTEVPALKSPGSNWWWPIIIILSAIAAGLVNFVFTDLAIRPVIVFCFLFICPGMVLVRFLRLKEPVVEWTLAIALSFAVDALVAGILLYAGKWSPTTILSILIVLSLGGALMQLTSIGSTTTYISKLSHILHTIKPGIPLGMSLVWVRRFWGTQLSPRLQSLMPGSVRSATVRQPNMPKSKSSVAQEVTGAVPGHRLHAPCAWETGIVLFLLALLIGLGVVTSSLSHVYSHSAISRPTVTSPTSRPTPSPTPVPTIHPLIAGTYNGTIYDLSSNESTSFSLSEVRQSQGKIAGYLVLGSKSQESGSFSGTIDTAKHLQFTVTDATGHAKFFFEGTMQSATSLSGDYYQCSSNPTLNSQCIRASGGYGIWNVVLAS